MLNSSISSPDPANPTFACVNAFVDELQRCGVQHVVICPGSRSTPLALAFVAQPGIRSWVLVDERSAAFFALGMARSLSLPVALLCTSGSAAANFFPAIVEAKLSHIPVLVLTADRPQELRDCGAPQAIDQNQLYGSYVKWFVDMALPEATNSALRSIRTIAGRSAALACANPAGPVHLNFPLREPLTPASIAGQPLPPLEQRDPIAWKGRSNRTPYIDVSDAPLATPSPARVAHLADMMRTAPRGLIVIGAGTSPALAEPLIQLARLLNYPILADPLSQLRCGSSSSNLVISSYDAFLRSDAFVASVPPQLVIRFGAMPTAKSLLSYLERYSYCRQVVIDAWGEWHEPMHTASEMIHADPVALSSQLVSVLEHSAESTFPGHAASRWCSTWLCVDQVTRKALKKAISAFPQLFEGRIFTELNDILPADATLYVGNSMPIRDLDTFFWCRERPVRILANRGANGIDGITSSALGASAVASASQPTVLVIGDLSFFHDLNGLLAARLYQLNMTIVLINNDGGGIFSFLPQADHPEHFEQLFGTPTGLNFHLAVQMYGGCFQRVDSWEQFRETLRQGLGNGFHVIEVLTKRSSNVTMHRHLWQVVQTALREQGIDMLSGNAP